MGRAGIEPATLGLRDRRHLALGEPFLIVRARLRASELGLPPVGLPPSCDFQRQEQHTGSANA
jgi:hypothetical protein